MFYILDLIPLHTLGKPFPLKTIYKLEITLENIKSHLFIV